MTTLEKPVASLILIDENDKEWYVVIFPETSNEGNCKPLLINNVNIGVPGNNN